MQELNDAYTTALLELQRGIRTRRLAQASVDESVGRMESALAVLRAHGNPCLQQRRFRVVKRDFGLFKRTVEIVVDAEGAWPIGTFTWRQSGELGTDTVRNLQTGYTPTGRLVPMYRGTEGDPVDVLQPGYRLWRPSDRHESGPSFRACSPGFWDITAGLEDAIDQAGLRRPVRTVE